MKLNHMLFCAVEFVGLAMATRVHAQADKNFIPAGDESSRFQKEVVLNGLDNPMGLLIQSQGKDSQIFFAESGAGRVLKASTSSPAKTEELVVGLSVGHLAPDVPLKVGPCSVGFVTPTKLAVWGSASKPGIDEVRVYVLPTESKPVQAADVDHTAELPEAENAISSCGFRGMAFGETAAFLTQPFSNDHGTLFRAALVANRMDAPRTLFSCKQESDLHHPAGICLSPSENMQFLVATYVGKFDDERDSRIAFHVPANGDLALELASGLFDVVGVAYGPSGQLYAIDFAWNDEQAGGVFRIDDARLEGHTACRAVKIAEVVRPTSLAFDSSGSLYVTSFGTGKNAKRGSIIKITGEF